MLRFSVFRVPVIVHPSLWMVLLLFSGIFSLSTWGEMIDVLTFVTAGFICLLVHELGHALVGQALAGGHAQVYLEWLGGNCWNPDAQFTRIKGVLMTAAGPLANLLLAGLALGVLSFYLGSVNELFIFLRDAVYPSCSLTTGILSFLRNLGIISLFISLLNLLPIYPFDGGQMLAGLMSSMRLVLQISVASSITMTLVSLALGWWIFALFFACMIFFNHKRLKQEKSA